MNRIVLVAGLLAVVHAPNGWAQTTGSSKKRLVAPLSRQELRVCMDRDDNLHRQKTALDRAQDEHRRAFEPISSSAKTLAEALRNLDTGNDLAVDHYNERVRQHGQTVTAYNKLSDALNTSAEELNAASADLMAQCWTRPFLRADEEAILKESGRKGESRRGERRTAPPSTSGQSNEI